MWAWGFVWLTELPEDVWPTVEREVSVFAAALTSMENPRVSECQWALTEEGELRFLSVLDFYGYWVVATPHHYQVLVHTAPCLGQDNYLHHSDTEQSLLYAKQNILSLTLTNSSNFFGNNKCEENLGYRSPIILAIWKIYYFNFTSLPTRFLKIDFRFFFLNICICLHVHYTGARCPWRPEEGIRSPGAGVVGGCSCELPCTC